MKLGPLRAPFNPWRHGGDNPGGDDLGAERESGGDEVGAEPGRIRLPVVVPKRARTARDSTKIAEVMFVT